MPPHFFGAFSLPFSPPVSWPILVFLKDRIARFHPQRPVAATKDRAGTKRTVNLVVPQIDQPGIRIQRAAVSRDLAYNV